MPNKRKVDKPEGEKKKIPVRKYGSLNFYIKKVFKKTFEGSSVQASIQNSTLDYLDGILVKLAEDSLAYCDNTRKPGVGMIRTGALNAFVSTTFPTLSQVIIKKLTKVNKRLNSIRAFMTVEERKKHPSGPYFGRAVKKLEPLPEVN